jgi:hypothetical protein
MFTKKWTAEFSGHQIKVTNDWFGGAKLYIDDELVDQNKEPSIDNDKVAFLKAPIDKFHSNSPIVEVFVHAIITVKAKICVDGNQIGGDKF